MRTLRLDVVVATAIAAVVSASSLTITAQSTTAQTAQQAQQPPTPTPPQATFRSATNLVEVDVVVQDRQGRFVPGLTIDDLAVLEDGQPQQIQQFYLVSNSGGSVMPTGSTSATPDLADPRGRRLFVFLFDESHLSNESLLRIKTGVERFLNTQFKPGDFGGIYSAGQMHKSRLTASKAELLTGLRAVQPAFDSRDRLLSKFREFPAIPSEADAARIEAGDLQLIDSLARKNCDENPQECLLVGGLGQVESKIQDKARSYIRDARVAASNTLDNLRMVASNLATIPGRKTVIFLSDGFYVEDTRVVVTEIAAIAARGGSAFYSVYGQGTSMVGGRSFPDVVSQAHSLNSTFDSNDDGLQILSSNTGGFVVRNLNDVSRALGLVARDTSTYYVLGYSPTNAVMDGKMRKIEVKSRADGLQVRARKGYVASPLPPMQSMRSGG
ncbi:MAG TPA: VWA domain-containing protein [Vicinamibacterales bacterium]|nr:VWA domain-containing protein [Vicinamibacterales bacterium]